MKWITLKRRRLLVIFFVTAVALALVAIGANVLIVRRAAPKIFKRVADTPGRYTIVVLGAFVADDTPSDVLEDRLRTAAAAYHAGLSARILVSGDHGRAHYDEVRTMRRFLIDQGVPSEVIFTDHAGFRTLDTMQRAAKVFGVGGAIVVTQEFHLARSLFLAEAAGLDAVGLVADRREYVYAGHYARREFLARAEAFLDVCVWGRGARFLGEAIPITGEAGLSAG